LLSSSLFTSSTLVLWIDFDTQKPARTSKDSVKTEEEEKEEEEMEKVT
jgi:hypothetical protein